MSDIGLCFLSVLLAFFLWLSWVIYDCEDSGFALLFTASVSLFLVSAIWSEARDRVARGWERHREHVERRNHEAAILAHAKKFNRVILQQYERLQADHSLVVAQCERLTQIRARTTSQAAGDLIANELKKLQTLRSQLVAQETKMRELMERSYLQHEVGKQRLARQVLSPLTNTASVAEITAQISRQSLRQASP